MIFAYLYSHTLESIEGTDPTPYDLALTQSLEGVIDFNQEVRRLEKEIGKISHEFSAVAKKLKNDDFLSKAPEAVVNKVKEKHTALMEKQQKLEAHLERIKAAEA